MVMILEKPQTKSKLESTLFPFQREGVDWLVEHSRGILADECGLGKTLQALALVERLNVRHALVVCPKTLVSEWFNQCDKWSDGDMLTPNDQGDRLDGLNLRGPHYVCVNYDLLANRRYWGEIQSVPWDIIIWDEAHRLKNPKAKRTEYAYLIQAPRVVFMSGTPLQNSPMDLYPLFRMINPKDYHNLYQWKNFFCVQVENTIWMRGTDGVARPRLIKSIVPGKINHTDELNMLLHKYMIRRTKKEVLPELPDKTYRTVPVELGPEKKQYDQMKTELFAILDSGEQVTAPKVIAQLMRLRQICLDPNLLATSPIKTSTPSNKTKTLLEIVEDTDDKVVIFTMFEKYAQILSSELSKHNITHVMITGQVDLTARGRAVELFQENPDVKVCLCTIGAGGEGITLTASHTAIFSDYAWNPAVNWQAEDRIHRIGQRENVLIIDLYCQNTIEDHLRAIVQSKKEMIERVVMQDVVNKMRSEI